MPENLALIRRARLIERLAHAATFPVVLIHAGGGFGKSTAVAQLLAADARAVSFAVPHAAGSLEAFLRAFGRALADRLPAFAATVEGAMIGARSADHPLDALVAWAGPHLEGFEGTIAIDDLHHTDIDAPGRVARFLTRLIETLERGPRWVFATRTTGALPVSAWTLYGVCDDPIEAGDLVMTADDALDLARASGSALGEAEIRHLVDFTGGWPVLLVYAVRSSLRVSDLDRVERLTRELTFRYLAEHLWSELAGVDRTLLVFAALLTQVALDDDLPGIGPVRAPLRRLAGTIPFVSLARDAFVIHDLLREFVLSHVDSLEPAVRATVMRRAAAVLERRGALGDALGVLVASGDRDAVRACAERNFETLIEDAHIAECEAIIAAFAPFAVTDVPDVVLALTVRLAHVKRESRQALAEQRELLRRNAAWRYRIVAVRTYWIGALNAGDPASATPEIDRMLADGPPPLARAYLLGCRATIAAGAGDTVSARADLDAAARLTGNVSSPDHAMVVSNLGIAYEAIGDLEAAMREMERAARYSETNAAWHLAAGMRINATIIAIHASEADALRANADYAIAASRSGGNWAASRTAHQLLSYFFAISNRPDEAESIVASDPAFPLVTLPNVFVFHKICSAIVAIARDEPERAYRLLSERRDWMTYAYLAAQLRALASALMGRNAAPDIAEARALIASNAGAATAHGGFPLYLAVATQLALGRWHAAAAELRALDRPAAAFTDLHEAMRSMGDGPPFDGVRPILERAAEAPFAGLLAAVALRIVDRVRETGFSASTIVLTGAESAVLLLIEEGRSYAEIAERRGSSLSTVKAQATSVFRKLGTPGNRVRALREAHRRGLLP